MLEQSLVTTKPQRSRFLSLPVSIALHGGVIAAAVAAAVWNVELPSSPPNQLATYSIGQAPAPPGPPPPRGGGEVRPKAIATPPEDVAPAVIPDAVPDLPVAGPADVPADDAGGDDPGGVPWGVDGGVGTGGGGGSVVQGGDQPAPILRPGGDVSIPVVLARVDPRYPEAARAARIAGTVIVECVIGSDGRVRDARVFRSAHPILDRAALDAVKEWRFKPASLNGNAVDVWFYLTVNFALDR